MMPMIASATIQRRVLARRVRKQRQAEAQNTVGAHLQHDAGQHDGARGRRFHVRVGQPGVQREQRHLDREGDEERQEQQQLLRVAEHQPAALNQSEQHAG